MPDLEALRRQLSNLEGRAYPAYKDAAGRYRCVGYSMAIDHVQGDPFADPSRLSVRLPLETTGIPPQLLADSARCQGICHYLARSFADVAASRQRTIGTGKGGLITIDRPGQEVLPTTAVQYVQGELEVRFQVGLPARGRRAMGHAAAHLLCDLVPSIVENALLSPHLDADAVRRAAEINEDAEALRSQLRECGLVAFVADGALLPRRSGIDSRPLEGGAVPFASPDSLQLELTLPNAGQVRGMGLKKGVTLIVGGGFHGKSTLLQALQLGVYNHCPGDGRERVVSDRSAVKIRAEDGRGITSVDISPFIRELPNGSSTRSFSTPNASGSTSQAANIREAIDLGCKLLLMDEDTSATNFMIRDQHMQELVARDKEPITPFLDRVRQLWEEWGVSTVLVMGGSGDYFDVADTVVAMDAYRPRDVTQQAKAIARRHRNQRHNEAVDPLAHAASRCPDGRSLDPRRGKKMEYVKSQGMKTLLYGHSEVDLSAVEQLVHPGQVRAIGRALLELQRTADPNTSLADLLGDLEKKLDRLGLDCLYPWKMGNLSGFRPLELAAALNRLRSLHILPRRTTQSEAREDYPT